MISIPKPPTGFSYYNSTTKELQHPTNDHRNADWHRASSAFHEKGSSSKIGHILQALTPDRISVVRSSSSHFNVAKSDRCPQSPCKHSPWKQEVPAPLPGWTPEDQQTLIGVLEHYPRAGRDGSQSELAIVKAARKLPHKTVEDCHLCVKHVLGSRVAIFSRK
jgi:hypothetical protein